MGKATPRKTMKPTSGGLFQRLFSQPLRERYCKVCGRPFWGQIQPEPTKRFNLGNVEVQLFESVHFGRLRRELKVQNWHRYRDDWYPQSVFTLEDFEHLMIVVEHALQFMKTQDQQSSRLPVQ
jgi:hypothetical protein